MPKLLIFAIISISLALVFYTIGVFAEKKKGSLLLWHVVMFWLGFICDLTGTLTMKKIAGGFEMNLHTITGITGILLMGALTIWATITLKNKTENSKRVFHKFSIVVWIIWLIPYFIGLYIGMHK